MKQNVTIGVTINCQEPGQRKIFRLGWEKSEKLTILSENFPTDNNADLD